MAILQAAASLEEAAGQVLWWIPQTDREAALSSMVADHAILQRLGSRAAAASAEVSAPLDLDAVFRAGPGPGRTGWQLLGAAIGYQGCEPPIL